MEKILAMLENGEVVCAECGRKVAIADAVEVNGDFYCADCVTECYECGEVCVKSEMTYCEENGKMYCDYCTSEVLHFCACCENYVLNTVPVRVEGRRYTAHWCDDCVERYATRCADCDEYFDSDHCEAITDINGRAICPCCASEYYYCERCGEYVHEDNYDTDAEMCYECALKYGAIACYHSHGHNAKKREFIGEPKKAWRGKMRGAGIELEIDRGDYNPEAERELVEELSSIYTGIMFERDGSLRNGFEIISQPHAEDALFNAPWKDILTACKNAGYTSHDNGRCGLHVHLSRYLFGADRKKQDTAIAKLITFYDAFYNEVLKISRRDREEAERWASPTGETKKSERLKIAKNKKYKGRYQCVNTTNTETVEIRIMRGTLNVDTFIATLDFVITTAKNTRKIKWRDITDAKKWLDGLKPETVTYIKSKNAFNNII